jgi:hypothetical protein
MQMISVALKPQKAAKKYGVTTEMENSRPSNQMHAVENIVARRTSTASEPFVDIRFD